MIPRLADLPYFLKVLARAATGQKLSIYTQIITGPRQSRRAGRRRGISSGHSRQRPLANSGQPVARKPVLHSLRRVPQCVSDLSQRRRARLWRRLCRADRRGADAALRRLGRESSSAARFEPVRRMPGGLSGQNSNSGNAHPPARAASSGAGAEKPAGGAGLLAVGLDAEAAVAVSLLDLARHSNDRPHEARRSVGSPAAGPARRLDAKARFPAPAAERFRDWWRKSK